MYGDLNVNNWSQTMGQRACVSVVSMAEVSESMIASEAEAALVGKVT